MAQQNLNGSIDLIASTVPGPGEIEKEMDARVYIYDLASFIDIPHFTQLFEQVINIHLATAPSAPGQFAEQIVGWHPKVRAAFIMFILRTFAALASMPIDPEAAQATDLQIARKIVKVLKENELMR